MYESHLLVRPDQEDQVAEFVCQHLNELSAKFASVRKMCTVTSSGDNPRQPMLTFMNAKSSSYADALLMHGDVERVMAEAGLVIVRSKLEGKLRSVVGEEPARVTGSEYYEFHVKVLNATTRAEWRRLAEFCYSYGVPLLYNADSKLPLPVTTMRFYETERGIAIAKHDEFLAALTDEGFKVDTVRAEWSVYDTNLYTDRGWLFESDPASFYYSQTEEAMQPPASWVEVIS